MPRVDRALFWSAPARRDLVEFWDYYVAEAGPAIAARRLRAIEKRAQSLLRNPFLGRPRSKLRADLRSLLVAPHIIFYRVDARGIEVVRVLHSRRDLDAAFADETP